MIDTHCHLTFPDYENRVGAVLDEARAHGVAGAITVSTTSDDAVASARLAAMFPNLWHTAGMHPLYADQPVDWDRMVEAASGARCVAWGELGLDNHYDRPPRDLQRSILETQLDVIIASEIKKPVVIHCRDAFDDLIPILGASSLPADRFVFHCFTGTPDDARKVLDFGAWISFTGIVTFKNTKEIQEACRLVPSDRIMIETDAPFLTPEPHRKIRPNEPRYAIDTARFAASLRNKSWDSFHATINENTHRFFGIPREMCE